MNTYENRYFSIEDVLMAMPELTALDNAYQALQPLGQAARRRALQWLGDALVPGYTVSTSLAESETRASTEPATVPVAVQPVAESPRRGRAAATIERAPVTVTAPKGRQDRRLKGGTAKATAKGERPYRRMPDPDTIMKAYRKVGSVSGLADRFEVPRHTVNHWARRLRSQGYEIGRA